MIYKKKYINLDDGIYIRYILIKLNYFINNFLININYRMLN